MFNFLSYYLLFILFILAVIFYIFTLNLVVIFTKLAATLQRALKEYLVRCKKSIPSFK